MECRDQISKSRTLSPYPWEVCSIDTHRIESVVDVRSGVDPEITVVEVRSAPRRSLTQTRRVLTLSDVGSGDGDGRGKG